MGPRAVPTVIAVALCTSFACGGGTPPPRVSPPPPPPPGATAQAPTGTVPTPATAPTPAAVDRLEIRWVRESAEYEALLRQTYLMAEDQVERAAVGRVA